jgi:2'-5' RNA ligase
MRLFVALEIPRHLRDDLERRARAAIAALPKARWVRPEAMHLTLSFLGETDPALLPALHRELDAAFAAAPVMGLRLGASGVFPPRGKARVIWTEIVDGRGGESGALGALQISPPTPLGALQISPPTPLGALQPAVAEAVRRAASIEPDARSFHPHVTLARCSPPWAPGAVERFLGGLGEPPDEAFEIAEGVLFESELRPSGARYRAVRTYPLGGST